MRPPGMNRLKMKPSRDESPVGKALWGFSVGMNAPGMNMP